MKVTLTDTFLKECLKQARFYEYCRDSARALTVLQPIWTNIDESPRIDLLSPQLAWEVLLVCGSVISVHGTTNQKRPYKELAVDMLTRARELAINLDERDAVAESEKQMAVAYWRHGEFENAVAFLNTVLSKYSEAEQLTNKICLLAQANLLVLYIQINQAEYAFELCHKIKPFVDDCDDLWVKTVFYNQAAGVYILTGNFRKAVPLLEKTVEYATATKNDSFLGNALNNLAQAYISLAESKEALRYVDKAIELFLSISQVFPYAQALETKAAIHLNDGAFKKALVAIDESIKILEEGENYAELCESLWTRTRILIATGEKKQAVRQFNSLLEVANENLSLLIGDRYIEQFTELLYLPAGRNFAEREENFRVFLLDDALSKCGGIVTATAKRLGMMHQTLSAILKKFPALVEKHQVKLRTRSAAPPVSSESVTELSENNMDGEFFAMRLSSSRLSYFGLKKGKIVSVRRMPLDRLDLSLPVVIQDREQNYHCGFLVDAFDMFAFEDGRGNIERTFLSSEIVESGQVVGIYDENDKFIPLEN